MPICPHCEQKLYTELSLQYIASLDSSIKDASKKVIESMSPVFQKFAAEIKNDEIPTTIPIYILSCMECKKALSIKFMTENETLSKAPLLMSNSDDHLNTHH